MLSFSFPKNTKSYWQASLKKESFQPLKENIETDIGIVGGGITGLTLAYLLRNEGLSITVIDANNLLSGTTSHTTAKITPQHGLIYHELINHYGLEIAKLYYDANLRGLGLIEKIIADEKMLDTHFTKAPSFLYTEDHEYVKKLEEEKEAYHQLNIATSKSNTSELPFNIKDSLSIENSAYFHPVHYLNQLISACQDAGVQFYENTKAIAVEYSKRPIIVCHGNIRMTCQYVVQASHYPFFDGQQFFPLKMYASRSYALLAKTEKTIKNMYMNVENPARSIRPVPSDHDNYLIVAGENHRTGVSDLAMDEHFNLLAAFTDEHFTIKNMPNLWSAQDYTTIDKLPYVGSVTREKDNVLVATGYRKWGMTNGTHAAILLKDLIMQKETPYKEIFAPYRKTKLIPSLKQFFSFNTKVAKHLVKGKFDTSNEALENLDINKAMIMMHKGQRIGVYKNEDGSLTAVDTTCTHMGCELAWNKAEKSWDCPCHGSRFSIEGQVLNGPALKNLKRIKL